jgi:hypothetical protein
MGFWTSVALVAMAIGSTVAQITQASRNKPQAPEPPKLPAIPTIEETTAAAEAKTALAVKEKRRAMARSRTIFTSPLGIAGEAETARKTLLGQ